MRIQAAVKTCEATDYQRLIAIAPRVENLHVSARSIDIEIFTALYGFPHDQLFYEVKEKMFPVRNIAPRFTGSINSVRKFGGMVVHASDIGADGLAIVRLVFDTTTPEIVEHVGISSRLEFAWLAAALRGICHGKV